MTPEKTASERRLYKRYEIPNEEGPQKLPQEPVFGNPPLIVVVHFLLRDHLHGNHEASPVEAHCVSKDPGRLSRFVSLEHGFDEIDAEPKHGPYQEGNPEDRPHKSPHRQNHGQNNQESP